jgi:hypothetical protein
VAKLGRDSRCLTWRPPLRCAAHPRQHRATPPPHETRWAFLQTSVPSLQSRVTGLLVFRILGLGSLHPTSDAPPPNYRGGHDNIVLLLLMSCDERWWMAFATYQASRASGLRIFCSNTALPPLIRAGFVPRPSPPPLKTPFHLNPKP